MRDPNYARSLIDARSMADSADTETILDREVQEILQMMRDLPRDDPKGELLITVSINLGSKKANTPPCSTVPDHPVLGPQYKKLLEAWERKK